MPSGVNCNQGCLSFHVCCGYRFLFSFSYRASVSLNLAFFEEAALHRSKKATFALIERKYLYSVLLIEDIKNQNRNKEFENNYGNDYMPIELEM